jgi:hypothetical protein
MSKWHFSTDPRENYKGLDVPSGHSALFRAMDSQQRFYDDIMRKQQEKDQLSFKNALNQAAQKAMAELNMVKINHLTVFNSKVKDEISIKILDPFIVELLKKNPIADLSHYTLNVLKHIRESYKLKNSVNTENIIKDNLGCLLTDYREIYNNISDPFKEVISDLFKAGSQIEIDSIKNAFLQNSNYLNAYFEYSDDNNNQSPISEIICKESLLKVIEDIGLKLENLNKAKSEQNDQEYLSKIESSNEEEKEPHEDISVDNSFHFSQKPSIKSESIPPEFEIVPMTELEKALARIKELEVANAKQRIENDKQTELFQQVEKAIADKDKDLDYARNMILDRDKIIDVQSHTIKELREDKAEIKIEKNEWKTKYEAKDNSLQKMIEELTIEKAKVNEFTQKLGLHNLDNHSLNSWEKLDQSVHNIGEGTLENQNLD